MKTLHPAYRVQDLERSADFYGKVGFREIGRVTFEDGSILLMLNLPDDGDVVTLELVYDPRIESMEIGKVQPYRGAGMATSRRTWLI